MLDSYIARTNISRRVTQLAGVSYVRADLFFSAFTILMQNSKQTIVNNGEKHAKLSSCLGLLVSEKHTCCAVLELLTGHGRKSTLRTQNAQLVRSGSVSLSEVLKYNKTNAQASKMWPKMQCIRASLCFA